MGKVAVIIPTTKGLSRVQQIRVDEQLRHAVMTVNFRTERSKVTIDYAEYVAKDAGIISHITQEHRYRVKLSRDIITGSSWKLGMLAAHVLKQSETLAEVDAPFSENATAAELVGDAARVIWASGDVSDEYGVLPVAQIKRKLALSQSVFEWCQEKSIPVSIYLPSVLAHDSQEQQAIEIELQKLVQQFPILRVHKIERASRQAVDWGAGNGRTPRSSSSESGALTKRILVGAAVVIGAVSLCLGVLHLSGDKAERLGAEVPQDAQTTQEDPNIRVSIFYDPNGDCFLNRGSYEELPLRLGIEPVRHVSLPMQAKTCRVEVLLDSSEMNRWAIRAEGAAMWGEDAPITLSKLRTDFRQPFYMARPNAIVFSSSTQSVSVDQEIRVELSYESSDQL